MVFIVFYLCVSVCVGMAIWASVSDLRGLKIPNVISVVILFSFFLAYGAMVFFNKEQTVFSSLYAHLGAGALVFVVTYIFFAFRMIGAGDSKLASAYAFWLGFEGLLPFVFYMSLVGGLLGLLAVVLKKTKPFKRVSEGSWLYTLQYEEKRLNMPYGVAIASGALISFCFLGYFNPDLLRGVVS